MPTCVIFNPAAKGDKARHFRHDLGRLEPVGAFKPTRAVGDGRVRAAEAVREGFDTLVAAGGDGTVNEVLNGIGDIPDGFQRVRLGVLPLGTMNVLAWELKLSLNWQRAWEVIQRGHERRFDVINVEMGAPAQKQTRCFVQMAGMGVDARAVELVTREMKKKAGVGAYLLAGWKALRETHATIKVKSADREIAGEQVLIGNGRYYGGPWPIFAHAKSDDGLMDVVVFKRAHWSSLLSGSWSMLWRRLDRNPRFHCFQTQALSLTSEVAVPVELDGEWVGQLPVTVTVRPQVLRLLAP